MSWILGVYGYITKEAAVAGVTTIQPESAIQGTRLLVSIYPAIPFLIGVGLLFFYEINKKMEVKIEEDLRMRRL